VKREDSSVLTAMEAIAAVGTSGAAAELPRHNEIRLLPQALTSAPVGQVLAAVALPINALPLQS
jgi:hypothetical protein